MSNQPTPAGMLRSAANSIARAFGYQAAEDSKKRKPVSASLKGEDEHLTTTGRAKLLGNARDAVRNFAVAGWMVRKHLDFVATHTFQAKSPDKGWNHAVEEWVAEVSKAENFDQAQDHGRERFTRMAEARRIIDGDVGLLQLASGHVQAIEGDRIRNPGHQAVPFDQMPEWQHGVRKQNSRKVAYAIHRRTGNGGFAFERVVPAGRMFLYRYHDTHLRFDSGRGVSPLAAALNDLRDVVENKEYALAKMKVAQMFGLKLTRNAENAAGVVTSTDTTDGNGNAKKKHEINFGNGPVFLDLDPGEDADFLENKTPSAEFQQFLQAAIGIALKSIDLPFSFYDEAYTNFFGSRAALLLYVQSAHHKRADVQELLSHWFTWRFGMAHARREIIPPRSLAHGFRYAWVPAGLPWWRPSEEIGADIRAVGAGFKARGDVTMSHFGRTFEDTLEMLQAEEDAIRAHRVNVYESPAAGTAAAGVSPAPAAFNAAELAELLAARLEMEKG